MDDGRCDPQGSLVRVEVVKSKRDPSDGSLSLLLRLSPTPDGGAPVTFTAAAPAERRASFEGSCLPFADERQAFEGAAAMHGMAEPIVGQDDGGGSGDASVPPAPLYRVRLRATPNAYYVGLGTVRVPPAVFVAYEHNGRPVRGAAEVAVGVPFRTLTYPALRGTASFYDVPVRLARSQQDILFASAFPTEGPDANPTTQAAFWGGRPPV